MAADALAARRDTADRTRGWLFAAILLEAALCYAMPVFFLALGTWFTPFVVVRAAATLGDPRTIAIIAEVALGWAGLIGVLRLLYSLWTAHALRRGITGVGLACGIVALVLAGSVIGEAGLGLRVALVYLPLACTAHLVYLARRTLFG